jgi:hypothetical protein
VSAIALDPLIAEAHRRTRRRRLAAAFALVAGVAIVAYGLGPGGWLSSSLGGHSARSRQSLAHVVIPVDRTERLWRSLVRGLGGPATGTARARELRSRALAIIGKTGATPIRIKVWRNTRPAAVEVVAATRMNPAEYLRHRAVTFVDAFSPPVFIKIVGPHGSKIFEWGGAGNTGFVGTPRGLDNCSPVLHWGLVGTAPCPVR